jgi:hypothetical protein
MMARLAPDQLDQPASREVSSRGREACKIAIVRRQRIIAPVAIEWERQTSRCLRLLHEPTDAVPVRPKVSRTFEVRVDRVGNPELTALGQR